VASDGSAIVSYLHKKNYPSVALSLTSDPAKKFQLALKSANLEAAYESAQAINQRQSYEKVAEYAMYQGNYECASKIYQEDAPNLAKLSFLNLITGNLGGLDEAKNQAKQQKNTLAEFNISLYQGDIRSRIKTLVDMGQSRLLG
jgi:coatomer subunit alpha